MVSFGLRNNANQKTGFSQKIMSLFFAGVLIFFFSLFVLYSNLSSFLFEKNKIDIFKQDLQRIAFYFLPVDQEFSHFLVELDKLIQSYFSGENILENKPERLEYTWQYIKKNKNYLKKLGFAGYDELLNFISDLWQYKEEFFDLMGKDKEYNYLFILQNTNEKRPNGGFFGSFAFLTMKGGHVTNFEIVDSYYPDFIAYKTRIIAPEWTSTFLPDRKIGYIAGNKFGFTDIDGKNLKDLYEKMFNETYDIKKVQQTMAPELYEKLLNKYIKGIIFIRSDMFETIIPNFQETIWEWQFVNASIDIIRGEYRGNKKELYIKEVKELFAKKRFEIVKNIVDNFGEITEKKLINIYLSNISTGLQNTLGKNHLITNFQPDTIYSWDTNVSYNKVDSFVEKTIQIFDENNQLLITTNNDIVPLSSLGTGTYTLHITYSLNVPESYTHFIQGLEKKYDITLTSREKGILALEPAMYEDPTFGKVWKRWESKSTIYFPLSTSVTFLTGEVYYQAPFTSPFANGIFYQMGITTNTTTKSVTLEFMKK